MTFDITRRRLSIGLVAAGFCLPLLPAPAAAQEPTADSLTIHRPWARPTIPNRPTAAYMTIRNTGATDDRLIAVASPAFGRIELHETTETDGVMSMGRVDGVPAPAGGEAVLAPRGLHVMLFDAVAPLEEGDRFPMTLRFEKAGDLAIEVAVARDGGAAMDHGGHGDHGDHGTMSTD